MTTLKQKIKAKEAALAVAEAEYEKAWKGTNQELFDTWGECVHKIKSELNALLYPTGVQIDYCNQDN